ncbi:DUF3108 domain-containing protein [Anianabacter salinae]|uniref:DUF3108 domain-containing protein n=1 Tax=Anianabacter salinae TaxID=2851023 RepID=UPI00225E3B6C|nr:DUF3108 domain-containing protein [Anianabacter salinae]MBV0911318.1 DUF3108 domain-containing protein [Anianabacter salinae]
MIRIRTLAAAAVLVLGQALSAAAQARDTTATFDVYFAGIKAGVAAFKGITTDSAYSVAGQLKSTGLISAVVDLRYDVKAQGALRNGTFIPTSYSENNNDGREVSRATMSFQNGVPRVMQTTPPATRGPNALDPATQGGTLDPATALFATLRDRPKTELCNRSVDIFDGSRRARIAIGPLREESGAVTCSASYQRIAGYEPWEMQERRVFPFELNFRPAGEVWQVSEVRIATVYGTAKLIRR